VSAKGLCRTKTPETSAEYAFVDYGVPGGPGEISRDQYEFQGYSPPFDEVPTKDAYEMKQAAQAGGGRGNAHRS
jgi:hypothetical protein